MLRLLMFKFMETTSTRSWLSLHGNNSRYNNCLRIFSIEHQWDTSQAKLRKINDTTWTQIDGTIDIVLAAVRSRNHDASHCKSALNNSLSILNESNQ